MSRSNTSSSFSSRSAIRSHLARTLAAGLVISGCGSAGAPGEEASEPLGSSTQTLSVGSTTGLLTGYMSGSTFSAVGPKNSAPFATDASWMKHTESATAFVGGSQCGPSGKFVTITTNGDPRYNGSSGNSAFSAKGGTNDAAKGQYGAESTRLGWSIHAVSGNAIGAVQPTKAAVTTVMYPGSFNPATLAGKPLSGSNSGISWVKDGSVTTATLSAWSTGIAAEGTPNVWVPTNPANGTRHLWGNVVTYTSGNCGQSFVPDSLFEGRGNTPDFAGGFPSCGETPGSSFPTQTDSGNYDAYCGSDLNGGIWFNAAKSCWCNQAPDRPVLYTDPYDYSQWLEANLPSYAAHRYNAGYAAQAGGLTYRLYSYTDASGRAIYQQTGIGNEPAGWINRNTWHHPRPIGTNAVEKIWMKGAPSMTSLPMVASNGGSYYRTSSGAGTGGSLVMASCEGGNGLYVWTTQDKGATWTTIDSGTPCGENQSAVGGRGIQSVGNGRGIIYDFQPSGVGRGRFDPTTGNRDLIVAFQAPDDRQSPSVGTMLVIRRITLGPTGSVVSRSDYKRYPTNAGYIITNVGLIQSDPRLSAGYANPDAMMIHYMESGPGPNGTSTVRPMLILNDGTAADNWWTPSPAGGSTPFVLNGAGNYWSGSVPRTGQIQLDYFYGAAYPPGPGYASLAFLAPFPFSNGADPTPNATPWNPISWDANGRTSLKYVAGFIW